MPEVTKPIIYTAGYANIREPQRLLDFAHEHDATVIDVRLKPYTSFSGWSRQEVDELFGERYRWVEWLGNMNYKGGDVQLRDADYGLQIVVPLLNDRSVIVLCGCGDPRTCHRSTVARLLSERTGYAVEHLSDLASPPDPDAPQQLSLF